MLQPIRNFLEETSRRCCNVSGTSWKLLQEVLEEDVTTYQELLWSYLKKMLERSMNVLILMAENERKYQERLAMLQQIKNVLEVTGKRCYNMSRTFWNWPLKGVS